MTDHFSTSPDETRAIARVFAKQLKEGSIILLSGTLGAGKTLFVQGLCEALALYEIWEVDSPTYTIMKEYQTTPLSIHFDLYRIQSESELEALSFYELMESDAIKFIEWPERLVQYKVPRDGFLVRINKTGLQQREIAITEFHAEI